MCVQYTAHPPAHRPPRPENAHSTHTRNTMICFIFVMFWRTTMTFARLPAPRLAQSGLRPHTGCRRGPSCHPGNPGHWPINNSRHKVNARNKNGRQNASTPSVKFAFLELRVRPWGFQVPAPLFPNPASKVNSENQTDHFLCFQFGAEYICLVILQVTR